METLPVSAGTQKTVCRLCTSSAFISLCKDSVFLFASCKHTASDQINESLKKLLEDTHRTYFFLEPEKRPLDQ